jgi:hypothetical protein
MLQVCASLASQARWGHLYERRLWDHISADASWNWGQRMDRNGALSIPWW